MKAIAVIPGRVNSVHLREVPEPKLSDIPNGRGVLVKTLQVGVDATDREINEALYGNPPPGCDYLILGHECFGEVIEVGPAVRDLQPGDLVTCTVRRPGHSLYDLIGRNDITSEETYYERGINLLHGFLTERFVDDVEYVVKVPPRLRHLGVLSEPASVCAKALEQAWLAQQRLQVWQPQRAFVLGAGQIGLLATLMLRLRGLEVFTLARRPGPNHRSAIVAGYQAHYVSTTETSLHELAQRVGKPDVIFEATGSSRLAFDAMQVLGLNGVLIWTSITGGRAEVSVPADRVNLEWVLGNKLLVGSVNGNRHHFMQGLQALAAGEMMYPGVTEQILTHPVPGLDHYAEMMRLLVEDKEALKVYVNVWA
ncbi:MAG: glucose dehydrogenase [Planctomycetaceae bacterium]|nr:MAG: glucose dehydrogenase [Planctomycetaceae bacterium]